jgi:hypothetical protein
MAKDIRTREKIHQILEFVKKHNRAPMQKFPNEAPLYRTMKRMLKLDMDPEFSKQVEKYIGGSKDQDVMLGQFLAASGGDGFN